MKEDDKVKRKDGSLILGTIGEYVGRKTVDVHWDQINRELGWNGSLFRAEIIDSLEIINDSVQE